MKTPVMQTPVYKFPQAKSLIPVSSPEDKEELEADQIAEQVMTDLQAEKKKKKLSEETSPDQVMGKGTTSGTLDAETEAGVKNLQGKGSPLPDRTRVDMERSFGADFSGVRIHTGPEAETLSRSMNARAFTYGSDIAFNKGEYSPDSQSGKRLLAHELTHTVQQGAVGRKVQREKEAEQQQGPIGELEKLGQEKLEQISKIMSDFKADFTRVLEKAENNVSSVQQLIETLTVSDVYKKLEEACDKIGIPAPDGIVVSVSGAAFGFLEVLGGGAGAELVHVKGYGWVVYGQGGLGLGVPGGGGALEVGLIWGLKGNPINYTKHFIELSAGKFPGSISVFGFGTGKDDIVAGFKGGLYVGSPGAGAQYEFYTRIYDFTTGEWFPDAVAFWRSF